MKNRMISVLIAVLLSIPISICTYSAHHVEPSDTDIDFEQYIVEETVDIETEVLGEEPSTDFVPGYYESESEEEELNPYPDSIVKYIEATAYCYGTTTCTGKPVREGFAAMSKRYLRMTAIVYEADADWEPLNYIGTYEIEDTGGDHRIKNGNCIDIYMSSREECINFGRRKVVVYLIEAKG